MKCVTVCIFVFLQAAKQASGCVKSHGAMRASNAARQSGSAVVAAGKQIGTARASGGDKRSIQADPVQVPLTWGPPIDAAPDVGAAHGVMTSDLVAPEAPDANNQPEVGYHNAAATCSTGGTYFDLYRLSITAKMFCCSILPDLSASALGRHAIWEMKKSIEITKKSIKKTDEKSKSIEWCPCFDAGEGG